MRTSTAINPVKVPCEIKNRTQKAILVEVAGKLHWLPISQLVSIEETTPQSVTVKGWLAKDRGLLL